VAVDNFAEARGVKGDFYHFFSAKEFCPFKCLFKDKKLARNIDFLRKDKK